ncbi:MAG: hypothetical protein ABIE14_01720 [Patescibacteria group bacterium]
MVNPRGWKVRMEDGEWRLANTRLLKFESQISPNPGWMVEVGNLKVEKHSRIKSWRFEMSFPLSQISPNPL